MFFSSYGSFIHKVMQLYLSGKLDKDETINYFLDNYDEQVAGPTPNIKMQNSYFEKSLDYLQTVDFPFKDIIAVEKKVNFDVGGYPFVGYIDVLAKVGSSQTALIDHKSHNLHKRSGRKFQTEYDKELDRYLRQLYLYSIPVKDEYGKYPATLNYNCYRYGTWISEKFDPYQLERVKYWAVGQIETIKQEEDWEPNPEPFYCEFLCDNAEGCPYRAEFMNRKG